MPLTRRAARKHLTVECEASTSTISASISASMKEKKVASKKKIEVKVEAEDEVVIKESKWEPANWRQLYDNIREMRKNNDAPVDEMGCERCADDSGEAKVFRFHTLVSLMLSSQTKDQITFAAMERLKASKLSVEMILETPEEDIRKLIYPVGFYKRKTVYLKQVAKILQEKYEGDIPASVEGLCSLPGVGPKMAYLCMQFGWGANSGIGVDTHVHRIANRLGWLKKESKTPEETRKGLEDWLPSYFWAEVNWMLVGFGQTICAPVRPKCESCLNKSICPTGIRNLTQGFPKSPAKNKNGKK